MQNDIEIFADFLLLMTMLMTCSLLLQVDPILASLWIGVTFLNSWHDS